MSLLPSSLLRYAVVGVVTNGLLYLVFVGLIWLRLYPPFAAGLCYVAGVTASYLLNRRWSFESATTHRRDLPRFLFSYGIGLVFTMLFILLLTKWMRPEIAQVLNIGLTALVIYACLRVTGFGKRLASNAD